MFHETETLEEMAIDLLSKEENSFLRKIKENWESFTIKEKKKAIMLDNLSSVVRDKSFTIATGQYIDFRISDVYGVDEYFNVAKELQPLFNDQKLIKCIGCQLGLCFFTLVKVENRFKYRLGELNGAFSGFNQYDTQGEARTRLLELFSAKELGKLETFFELDYKYLNKKAYDDENGCSNDQEFSQTYETYRNFRQSYYDAYERFIIINMVFFEHLDITDEALSKYYYKDDRTI